MQPLTAPPRSLLSQTEVLDLISSSNLRVASCGLAQINSAGTLLHDFSSQFANGEINRDNYAKIHGSCELTIHGHIPFASGRFRPSLTLADDDSGITAEFNLGVYVLDVPVQSAAQSTPIYDVTGFDLLSIVDDLVGESYTVSAGTNVVTAVQTILNAIGESNHALQTSSQTLPNTKVWPMDDSTTWLDIINDLLSQIGYDDLWVDWNGQFRSAPVVESVARPSEYSYTTDQLTTIVGQNRDLSPDYFKSPNRWVFIRDDLRSGRFTLTNGGVYEVENITQGETSQSHRGRVITKVEYIEAIDSASLQAAGNKIVEKDRRLDLTVTAETRVNPLHWHLDAVTWRDPQMSAHPFPFKALVHEWTMPINRKGMQKMILRKID